MNRAPKPKLWPRLSISLLFTLGALVLAAPATANATKPGPSLTRQAGQKSMVGTVSWFNNSRGYGEITGQNGQRYLVHFSQVPMTTPSGTLRYRSLNKDTRVIFRPASSLNRNAQRRWHNWLGRKHLTLPQRTTQADYATRVRLLSPTATHR